jgi:hypothetical protein
MATPPDLSLQIAVDQAISLINQFGWLVGAVIGLTVGSMLLIWIIKEIDF